MTPFAMELAGVTRTFPSVGGDIRVLEGVDLCVETGDRIVLFGPSGCGKTTLLHVMALLDRPSSGNVLLRGENSIPWTEARRAEHRARHIGLVFQQFHLLPWHSVRDNLRLRLRYLPAGTVPRTNEDDLLARVGLAHRADHPARLLSGGERQRLCVARALHVPPDLLLADEPTGNLDERNSDAVRNLFREVADRKTPVVIATHDTRWLPFATRVFRFEQGRLTEEP